jgi:hypothetical protein
MVASDMGRRGIVGDTASGGGFDMSSMFPHDGGRSQNGYRCNTDCGAPRIGESDTGAAVRRWIRP